MIPSVNVEAIFNYMRDKGLSRQELCEKANISLTVFARMIHNPYNVNYENLFLIANALGVSLAELLKTEKVATLEL